MWRGGAESEDLVDTGKCQRVSESDHIFFVIAYNKKLAKLVDHIGPRGSMEVSVITRRR